MDCYLEVQDEIIPFTPHYIWSWCFITAIETTALSKCFPPL
ncbi:rCG63438, partial [Rattus norvegicus]